MLIPISWLKDYVDIKLPLKDLMWKMTEAGLTCESYKTIGKEIILDVEVTANRPDWMSIKGVAREVAAIQGIKIKEIKSLNLPKPKSIFPIDLVPNFELIERWSAIVIKDIEIKPSPEWLTKRLKLVGLRPINNVIDITNYVMFDLGIPMHAFDYDEIHGQIMTVDKSKGNEKFTSVDELSYKLPKDAMIIRDENRIIDLVGIKGGLNSGIKSTTKNIFLHVTIDNPILTRHTSQALGLRSEASAIYERGPNKGGTVESLVEAANLILKLANGKIASSIIDIKKEEFKPKKLELSFNSLEKVLGINIPEIEVIKILSKLSLNPKKTKNGVVCTIPTFRGDIKIEEDLIEEVARIYGYNKFPKTLPSGKPNTQKIPYYFDDRFHLKLKELLVASGFTEVKTLSLVSRETIHKFGLKDADHIKLTNPVSSEYEYMRSTLIPSIADGIKVNGEETVLLFELDKVYPKENYKLGVIGKGISFRKFKGSMDLVLKRLNINNFNLDFDTTAPYWHPSKAGALIKSNEKLGEFGYLSPQVQSNLDIEEPILAFEMDVWLLEKYSKQNIFKPVPENPAQKEDITFVFPPKTRIGDVIQSIKSVSNIVSQVSLTDIYKDSFTLRIYYQHPTKTLNDQEVEEIRTKIIKEVKEKFGGSLKS